MNFEFSEEQQLLREQARGFLTEHCPTTAVRAVLDGEQDWDAALWQKVAEMGWTATVISEAYGGLGLSYYELAIIAEEMGRSAAPLPFSSSVYLASEAIQRFGLNSASSRVVSYIQPPVCELEQKAAAHFGTPAATTFASAYAGPMILAQALADEIAGIVEPVAVSLDVPAGHRPFVILVVGVNGSGKTTSVGKLAHLFGEAGQKVKIAACDTFRAAASEQLMLWGERAGAQVLSAPPGSDASGLAYQSLQEARADGTDVLLIDTAGRLQNRADLMAELQKIRRVLQKQDETAPHAVLLVLDATTGQNAHSQVEIFREMVDVTGLALTKLDGSAKGGVLVGLARRFGLPVHAIGVGEGVDDLRPFEARAFARGLLDLDDA